MSTSNRWLVIMAAVLALVVLASAAVTLLASDEAQFPADTPEGAVQRYFQAVADRDTTEARSYLAPELATRCEELPQDSITNRGTRSFGVTLTGTEAKSDRTEVRVKLTESSGSPPFGGDSYSQDLLLQLRQVDGQWRFIESPWPLYCATKFPERPAPAVPAATPAATAVPAR